MTKQVIAETLEMNYIEFTDFINSLKEDKFTNAAAGKWNAGQQLDHLLRAVSPLAAGLRLPKFIFRIMFGKANRPSKAYEELVQKYLSKLENGGKARGRFIPGQIKFSKREKSATYLLMLVAKLIKNINSYSEKELDTYIIPHPLLGKLTIREMMYFTIYHAEHHLRQVRKNLAG